MTKSCKKKELKQNDDAIKCFRNSVNINPDFFEAYMQLGQIFHLLEDTIAVKYYNNALRLQPTNEMALYNKALFFQNIFHCDFPKTKKLTLQFQV